MRPGLAPLCAGFTFSAVSNIALCRVGTCLESFQTLHPSYPPKAPPSALASSRQSTLLSPLEFEDHPQLSAEVNRLLLEAPWSKAPPRCCSPGPLSSLWETHGQFAQANLGYVTTGLQPRPFALPPKQGQPISLLVFPGGMLTAVRHVTNHRGHAPSVSGWCLETLPLGPRWVVAS